MAATKKSTAKQAPEASVQAGKKSTHSADPVSKLMGANIKDFDIDSQFDITNQRMLAVGDDLTQFINASFGRHAAGSQAGQPRYSYLRGFYDPALFLDAPMLHGTDDWRPETTAVSADWQAHVVALQDRSGDRSRN